ncbi:MAG: sigmaY antisigma factor component [Chloroflexota bacterium]
MRQFLSHPPWYALAAVGAVVLIQGTWLFLDARRRGNHPWLWGLWGLTTVPLPFLLYYFLVVRPGKRH